VHGVPEGLPRVALHDVVHDAVVGLLHDRRAEAPRGRVVRVQQQLRQLAAAVIVAALVGTAGCHTSTPAANTPTPDSSGQAAWLAIPDGPLAPLAASSDGCDVSTDESARASFDARHPSARHPASVGSYGVLRSARVPGLVGFMHLGGDAQWFDGVLYRCTAYLADGYGRAPTTPGRDALFARLLEDLGWRGATPERRLAIAVGLLDVERAVLGQGARVLTSHDGPPSLPGFAPPSVHATPDGGVCIDHWAAYETESMVGPVHHLDLALFCVTGVGVVSLKHVPPPGTRFLPGP